MVGYGMNFHKSLRMLQFVAAMSTKIGHNHIV